MVVVWMEEVVKASMRILEWLRVHPTCGGTMKAHLAGEVKWKSC